MNETRKERNEVAAEVGVIFAKVNKTICCDCPMVGSSSLFSKEKGCCTKCGFSHGYFWMGEISKRVYILKQKHSFTKEDGFFDINKHRCKLPRFLRSNTCLRYACDHIRKNRLNDMKKVDELVDRYSRLKSQLGETK